MALPADPEKAVMQLASLLESDSAEMDRLGRHYDLTQPLSYMHPELWQEVSDRIKPVLIAWPQLVVDSIEERLDVTGFRYAGAAKDDDRLWSWWQANNLDEGSQQEHLEALIRKRAFVIVGPGDEDDTPRITVESPQQVYADFDPQTRKVRAALKQWTDGTQRFATLYLPDITIRYSFTSSGGLTQIGEDPHGLGVVPVVPFVNRGRILQLDRNKSLAPPGVSEMQPILPLSDAACKIATDMMTAAETVAIPSRYAFGLSRDEFEDDRGNKISPWKTVLGKIWAHEDKDIVAGQWPAAELANFHSTLNELARICGAVAALPPHYLGFTTDNPASADAIRSNEARLVKRAERKQTSFGESWEAVMSLAIRIVDGEWDPEMRMLETRWRDASTPTKAQTADAITKLATGPNPILSREGAWDELGWSDQRKEVERQYFAQQAADPVTGMNAAAAQIIENARANAQPPASA